MKTWVRRHPVAFYFVLAYAISWSIAVPLALQARGILDVHLPWALHYLTAYGPALAALSMMRLLREPLGGTGVPAAQPWSRTARWWAIGFSAPLLMFAATQLAARAADVAAAVTSTLVMVWAIVVMVAGTLGTPRGVYGRSVRASAEDAA